MVTKPHMVQWILSAHHSGSVDLAPSREESVQRMSAAGLHRCVPGLRETEDIAKVFEHITPFLNYDIQFDIGRQLGCVKLGESESESEGAMRVAWLPPTARPGDEVCWFGGAGHAVVLRPIAADRSVCGAATESVVCQGSEEWILLGDAWVDAVDSDCTAFGLSAQEKPAVRSKGTEAEARWWKWEKEHLGWIVLV